MQKSNIKSINPNNILPVLSLKKGGQPIEFLDDVRMGAMGEIASAISHELNQPICVLKLALEALGHEHKLKSNNNKTQKILEKMEAQLTRVTQTLRRMRHLTSDESQCIEPQKSPLCLKDSIKTAVNKVKTTFALSDINLNVNIDKNIPKVRIAHLDVEQIMFHLLNNARLSFASDKTLKNIKHKEISINLQYDKLIDSIVLEVCDNGKGMDDTTLTRCIEPFFSTRRKDMSLGLGLSLCDSMITKAQGDMYIHSMLNHGTQVQIVLPPSLNK